MAFVSSLSSRAPAAPLAVKGEAIMTKSHDYKPINFVGLYFLRERKLSPWREDKGSYRAEKVYSGVGWQIAVNSVSL